MKLPQGWEKARFGDIFELQPKTKIKAGEGNGTGKHKFFTSSSDQTKFIDRFEFDGDHLVLGTGGMASIHYCDGKFATSTDCFVVKTTRKDVFLKFVYYYLKGNMRFLEQGFRGAGLKHLSRHHMNDILIPLPPLATQKKIVSIIEKAEKLKESREEADRLTDELLKAVFYDMFGDPVKNEKKWERKKFEEILSIPLNHGWSPVCSDESVGIPVFSLANLRDDGLNNEITKYYSGEPPKIGLDLESDDLLISRSNTPELVGRVGRYMNKPKRVIYPDLMIRARINKHVANPIFIEKILQILGRNGTIKKMAHGSSGSMVKISQKTLITLDILSPPLQLQNKFGKISIDFTNLKDLQIESKKKIEDLTNAFIQKAFSGELSG